MGQNFLIEEAVPRRIAECAGVDGAGVLEIGPGIGALTAQLAARAEKVVPVELDRSLAPLLEETLAGYENVEIVFGDILKTDVAALLDEKLSGLRRCVCANLPYNITTPVLTKLINTGGFESITVMVQREVARRIAAAPGTADYGAFSVFISFYTEPEILFDVSPDCFMPQPKVWSSVVKLHIRKDPFPEIPDRQAFFSVVRAAFAQRRKTLLNCLSFACGSRFSRQELADMIASCGISPGARGETLGIPEYALLAEKLGNSTKSE